jgi:hypothetical protein
MYIFRPVVFCLFLCFISSCLHHKSNVKTNHNRLLKPQHHIFLIHGIGGDRSHFGSMKQSLVNAFSSEQEEQQFHVHFIEYDTKNNNKTIQDFSLVMNEKIEGIVGDNLPDSDKISIVMHSQGGLVGSIWLFRSLQRLEGYGSDLIDNVDCFMTFGTPFWGAKTAIFAKRIKDEFSKVGIDLPLPFGTKQLGDMEFGSDWSYHMRTAIIESDSNDQLTLETKGIRFLNVAGIADVLSPLGHFVSGGANYEDDSAVPLPSSRFNFLYHVNGVVKEIDWSPYYLVDALHLSPLPEERSLYGLVQIPKNCIQDRYCDHPTFELIWKTILHAQIPKGRQVEKEVRSFMIDLNVQLPKGRETSSLEVELLALDGDALENSRVRLSSTELYGSGSKTSKKYKTMIRYYFNGYFKDSNTSVREALLIRISGVGLSTQEITMTVQGGYSSFADIKMESI